MTVELTVWSPEINDSPLNQKQTLIEGLEKNLPKDSKFWWALDNLEKKVGSDTLVNAIESKKDFIDYVRSVPLLQWSIKQIIWYIATIESDFYKTPNAINSLKRQIRLHAKLHDVIIRLRNFDSNGWVNDKGRIKNIILISYLEGKALSDLSTEEIDNFDELIGLFERLISIKGKFGRYKEFLSENTSNTIQEQISWFEEDPHTMWTEELWRVEHILKWSLKVSKLQDAYNRSKSFMPKYIREDIQWRLTMYSDNPENFWTEEYNRLQERIGVSRDYFNQMKTLVISQSDIHSFWPDFTFDTEKEPYDSLFSAITALYMEEYADSIKNSQDFLNENQNGLAIDANKLKGILKNVSRYLWDSNFPNAISINLTWGDQIDITAIVSGNQAKIELVSKKDTKKILTLFSLINNGEFPTTQAIEEPSLENIASLVHTSTPDLIKQIQELGIMSSVEQSRSLDQIAEQARYEIKQWNMSYTDIFNTVSRFIKPGSREWSVLIHRLVSLGLMNDSDGLKILEGPHGFQEDGGISLNEYLSLHGMPDTMKQAASIIIEKSTGIKPTKKQLNYILIDVIYRNQIESRGWYNIKNDQWGNAQWYVQIIPTNGRWDKQGRRLTSSLETGFSSVKKLWLQSVINMYPGLRSFYNAIPTHKSEIDSGKKPNPNKQNPRLLSSEEQMIWAMLDGYTRPQSKTQVEKILKWNFDGTRYIYAHIHHTEWLTHGPTKNVMEKVWEPILKNAHTIIQKINSPVREMKIASVWVNIIDTMKVASVDSVVTQKKEKINNPIQEFPEEKSNRIVLKDGTTTVSNIPKWWTLGKSLYNMISQINPRTSFSGSWELAVLLQWGIWNIPVRAWEAVEVSWVKTPDDLAYYVKVGSDTHIAITKDKKFIRLDG